MAICVHLISNRLGLESELKAGRLAYGWHKLCLLLSSGCLQTDLSVCTSVSMCVCVIECNGICIDTVYSGPHGQYRHVSISGLCVFADCFRSYIKPTCA